MTVRLGLVGCGVMGRRHIVGMGRLKAVGRLRFELAAVCDVLIENAAQAAAQAEAVLGHEPGIYAALEAMLREGRLDALLVTTTPETHAAVALMAFEAGVDVMVEKPIALTAADGRRMTTAARAAGRTLAVAENYRRDPMNRLGKALVEAGAVGRPYLAVQSSSGSGEFVILTPWRHRRDRGGIVLDMGVHYTDILEYYLGPIELVGGMSAVVDDVRLDGQGQAHPADAEDLSVGVMRFRCGAIGNWMLNLAGRGEAAYARLIHGTDGSLSIPGDRSGGSVSLVQRQGGQDVPVPQADLLALAPDFCLDPTTAALFGGERLTNYDLPWAEIDANLLAIEQADFVAAIAAGREPEVTGEQGLRSLAVIEGLLRAEHEGRMMRVEEIMAHD
jgi:predicted dehydrogenase